MSALDKQFHPVGHSEFKEFYEIYYFLRESASRKHSSHYWVPSILTGGTSPNTLIDVGNPYVFYLRIFEGIVDQHERKGGTCKTWKLTQADCIYQSFIRNFATLNGETGTALKQIAFLPFLQNSLGVTVFLTLPTGTVGYTNRKGTAGSPFAVRNPFDVDASFSDPLLPSFSALFQYKALVQASTMLGIAPGSIVPLATLSIDSPLFAVFPDLGFWWMAAPGECLYSRAADSMPVRKVECGDASGVADISPQLSDDQKLRFCPPPAPSDVECCVYNGQKYHRATAEHAGRKFSIGLANSFPDIIAGAVESYTWSDVATLNYTDATYPYPLGIRNTASYDPSRPAWRLAPLLLAWRACELGERVFLVDVSANIPEEVLWEAQNMVHSWREYAPLARALSISDPSQVSATDLRRRLYTQTMKTKDRKQLPEERRIFFIAEELWDFNTPNAAADAVVGPLIFCVAAHTHNHDVLVNSLRYHLKKLAGYRSAGPFLAGVSNHDTMPPVPEISPLLHVFFHLLPGGIPMIFSGAEHHSQMLTNKEFGFNTSPELLTRQKELRNHSLGLFNNRTLDWRTLPKHDRLGRPVIDICQLLADLHRIREMITFSNLEGFRFVELVDGGRQANCFGFIRFANDRQEDGLLVCANWDADSIFKCHWTYPTAQTLLAVNNPEFSEVVITGSSLEIHPLSAVVLSMGDMFRKHG